MNTLIENKDKDRRFIKNWWSISSIDVDVRTASKVIARRLEQILPYLIHLNQNGFIKGRSVVDRVRTVKMYLNLPNLQVVLVWKNIVLQHTFLSGSRRFILMCPAVFWTMVSLLIYSQSDAGLGKVTPCHLCYLSLLLKCSPVDFVKTMKLKVYQSRRKKSN